MTKPTGLRKMFHPKKQPRWFWPSTMSNRLRLPVRSTTDSAAAPIASSYEIICADDRSPPSSEYFEFDDHPASVTP